MSQIWREGDKCRHCFTRIVRVNRAHRHPKQSATHRYEWIYQCPQCRAIYLDEAAKRAVAPVPQTASLF
jgi:uncharacterized protein with PIN domain